ncbi:MAG: DUF4956 domain-containing protein [Candidatus Promineifilaceae bacterium]|nr:DUF4956 domain-containing protein [Candidatus Promineifilaceae bacterium]
MNLQDLLIEVDYSPTQILLGLLIAFGLGFIWATVYRKTHTGIAYTRAFFLSLILIPPIIAMIMMAIGSNVALSLGLVGSLSVIRFRTAIKDTKDMTFLFMAVAIGLTAGAFVWLVGIIGTVVVVIIVLVMSRAGHDRAGSGDYILIFRSHEKEPWTQLPADAQSLISWKQLRGATELGPNEDIEYTYNVRLASKVAPEQIVSSLSNGIMHQVTMIAPENHLEL